VKVVGDLVRVGADQRAFHLVDRAVESPQRYIPELVREGVTELGIKMLPEAAAAADDVLPKPRLALVHAR
jgi:hypothetical protein